MDDATEVASLSFEIDTMRQVIADQDFKAYTRPYESTLFGTIHLLVDGEEITHTNKLPAEFDLVDTVRAQHELVETLETAGEYEGTPFCCVCSTRGCSYLHWTVTHDEGRSVSIAMKDLGGEPIGQSPYRVPKSGLYAGLDSFWTEVLEFCSSRDINTFGWAEWKETPVAGREAYATTPEMRSWRADLAERLDG